ncbi:MAG: ECF transporter S component [Promethearchaeota archaeon]
MTEKTIVHSELNFLGYYLPSNPLVIAIAGIFIAFTCGMTLLFPLLFPQGYINIGDLAVMITALLFGPIIGAIAGGIGPMIADFILYPLTAFLTLVIKMLEGFLVGIIANPRKNHKKIDYRTILGLIIGGLTMVFGYFFGELIIFQNPGWAFEELPFNFFIQFGIGIIGSIIFIISFRKSIIEGLPQVFDKIFILEDL